MAGATAKSRILIEAAVDSLDAAIAAERVGAQRIELCARLDLGGITPSPGLVEKVLATVTIPVHLMIRPRGGDFVYGDDEIAQMLNDISLLREPAPAGFVSGALSAAAQIDESHLQRFIGAANGVPFTFHRAFDRLADLEEGLNTLMDLGIERVLTSGGAASALEGAAKIAALVEHAHHRIGILAGGGVRSHNVRELIARTGVREVHARFVDDQQMRSLVAAVGGESSVAS